jgi:VWFA-related protein
MHGRLMLVAAVLAALPAPLSARQAALRIVEPTEDAFLAGPVFIEARVEPESTRVRRIDFFVDGAQVCQVTRPPFDCQWNAGLEVRSRLIRVAATLENGDRLVENVRTKALDLTDSTGVDAVMVPVVVTDGRGRFVGGLTQTAFRIFEDDRPQEITYFQSQSIPLDIAVAVDISGSMEPTLGDVRSAVRRFVQALKPIDRLTLVAFNERVFVLTKQDTNPATRGQAVDKLRAAGRTSLRDAIVSSLDLVGGSISRRAVVVFTDGEDTQSLASLDAVEKRLRESDASLYIITHGPASQSDSMQSQMQRLAALSGGRAFRLRGMDQLQPVFDLILEDLAHHYLLGYSPADTAKGTYHRIRVAVPGRRLNIRARDGYWRVP